MIQHSIIERNRGGYKGMHGFIAEVAECGVGNAKEIIQGRAPDYIWVNDNGPVDLIKNGQAIQQKFVNSGNHLSLRAISQHLEHYPNYLKNGGKYMIPKDHYEKIMMYLNLSPKEANKLATSTEEFSLKQYNEVHQFFNEKKIDIHDIEPSQFNYRDVAKNKIEKTLDDQSKVLKKTNQQIQHKTYEMHKPSVSEGMHIAAISAGAEGATSFIQVVIQQRKEGKFIKDYDLDDWYEILEKTGVGIAKGGVRGISIYALTSYTATPAAVANSLCTISFGLAHQLYLYRNGVIDQHQFLINSENLCLDCTVSAMSSLFGQVLIPIPVIGAVIGNSVGTLLYQLLKDQLTLHEKKQIKDYLKQLEILDRQLDKEYQTYIKQINNSLINYYNLLESSFSPDYRVAFDSSIALAKSIGISDDQILKNKQDIDDYFLR